MHVQRRTMGATRGRSALYRSNHGATLYTKHRLSYSTYPLCRVYDPPPKNLGSSDSITSAYGCADVMPAPSYRAVERGGGIGHAGGGIAKQKVGTGPEEVGR